tara:strand:- start:1030 stop:1224 length:195 start_codon:yes stop_codon:yes gene_type:complete
MLKSIARPLPQVKFFSTAGINESLAPRYSALDNVLCIGDTWMLDKKLIAAKDWAAIEAKACLAS